ncbi:hypothetical protein ACLI1A_18785 [Flavobacterium sp. RHBU_3]|uniref:hypothetical protein n=1 Tax=Flavobacterium sp. RHBU_3 TaxID=3391184 RepID=UPI003984DC3B
MKTDRYTKIVLTIIAVCLAINVLQNINIIPSAYAASGNTKPLSVPGTPQYGLVPLNADGSITVKLAENNPMEVKIVGISTYDEMPVNLKEIDGRSLFNGIVPVKIKE